LKRLRIPLRVSSLTRSPINTNMTRIETLKIHKVLKHLELHFNTVEFIPAHKHDTARFALNGIALSAIYVLANLNSGNIEKVKYAVYYNALHMAAQSHSPPTITPSTHL